MSPGPRTMTAGIGLTACGLTTIGTELFGFGASQAIPAPWVAIGLSVNPSVSDSTGSRAMLAPRTISASRSLSSAA